jgi:NAD-dependent SIR2 family protein deacetylase
MRAMPDAGFTDQDMAKIHASLDLLRCTQCHGADTLRTLAIKSPAERMRIIREMVAKPGSNITPDEVTRISRAYQQMVGF